MPPSPKFTRDEIVAAALQVVSERGKEALSAREVAAVLGSSARPIFTVFSNMEELQQEKAQLAEERRQSAAMLAELQALRAQLGMKDDAPSPTPDDHPSAEEKIPAERDS